MTKISPTIENDIFIKIQKGTRIIDLMNEYKLSRSSLQRINNKMKQKFEQNESENDSHNESENESLNEPDNESSNESLDNESLSTVSILGELNKNDVSEDEEEEEEEQEEEKIEPVITKKLPKRPSNAEMNRFMKSYKPVTDPEPFEQELSSQPIKKSLITDPDLPDKRNKINQIKRYIYEFEPKLIDIIGESTESKKMFITSLNNLSVSELDIVLDNVRFILTESKMKHVFTDSFFLLTSQLENLGKRFNYKIDGLTIELKKNNEIYDCLRELSCKYDISNYVSPETRLLSCIALSAMQLHQHNTLKTKMNDFLDDPIDKDLAEKFSHL